MSWPWLVEKKFLGPLVLEYDHVVDVLRREVQALKVSFLIYKIF